MKRLQFVGRIIGSNVGADNVGTEMERLQFLGRIIGSNVDAEMKRLQFVGRIIESNVMQYDTLALQDRHRVLLTGVLEGSNPSKLPVACTPHREFGRIIGTVLQNKLRRSKSTPVWAAVNSCCSGYDYSGYGYATLSAATITRAAAATATVFCSDYGYS